LPWSNQGFCCFESKGLVAWVHIDTDRGGIAATICVECLKRIIDRSECVMEVAFRRKEKKRATLANQRSRADAQEVRQARTQESQAQRTPTKVRARTRQGQHTHAGCEERRLLAEICGQAGYQALAQLRGRVPELLERHGLGEEVLIEKYLKPLLEAEETKFFNEGKTRINSTETMVSRLLLCPRKPQLGPSQH
jgi:hypothetical protein